jgi:hypothetical protein
MRVKKRETFGNEIYLEVLQSWRRYLLKRARKGEKRVTYPKAVDVFVLKRRQEKLGKRASLLGFR